MSYESASGSLEYIGISEQKTGKEQLSLKDIDKMAEDIITLRDFINIYQKSTPDELEEKMKERFEKLINDPYYQEAGRFFKEYEKEATKYQPLYNELELVENEIDEIVNDIPLEELDLLEDDEDITGWFADNDPEMYQRFIDLTKKQDVIREDLESLESIGEEARKIKNLVFLEEVDEFFETILHKRKEVIGYEQRLKEDQGLFFKEMKKETEIDLSVVDPKDYEIISSGYSFEIILKKEIFEELLGKGYRGIHQKHTVFNFICRSTRHNELGTINHEQNHNITESFEDRSLHSEDFLQSTENKIEKLKKLKSLNSPEIILHNQRKEFLSSIENYSTMNYNELVADIDMFIDGKFGTHYNHFNKAIKGLKEYVGDLDDQDGLKGDILEAIDKSEEKYVNFIKVFLDVYTAIENLGTPLDKEKIKAIFILFKGKGNEQIIKYVKSLYGEENYEIVTKLSKTVANSNFYPDFQGVGGSYLQESSLKDIGENNLVFEILGSQPKVAEFLQLDNLRELVNLLDNLDISKNDKISIFIKNYKEQLVNSFIPDRIDHLFFERRPELLEADKILELESLLKQLDEELGVDKFGHFLINNFAYSYLEYYYESHLVGSGDKDLSKLQEAYNNWPLSDKSELNNFIKNTLMMYLWRIKTEGEDPDFVKDIENFIKSVGFPIEDIPDYLTEQQKPIKTTGMDRLLKALSDPGVENK